MKKDNNQQQNNPEMEELIKNTVEIGQRLGVLLNALNISDEQKSAIVEILPEFTYEQLVDFTAVLESTYTKQQTEPIDQDFLQNIKKIQADYEEKNKKRKEEFNNDLADLEADLDTMSK